MTTGWDDDNLCHAGPDPAQFLRDRKRQREPRTCLALCPDGMTGSLGHWLGSLPWTHELIPIENSIPLKWVAKRGGGGNTGDRARAEAFPVPGYLIPALPAVASDPLAEPTRTQLCSQSFCRGCRCPPKPVSKTTAARSGSACW
jgi:hypothetical protein